MVALLLCFVVLFNLLFLVSFIEKAKLFYRLDWPAPKVMSVG